jgi:hypothetical protein
MLFTSIAMLVVASAQLKGIPNIWDAQRYKLALTAAAAQVSTGRIVRIVFPLAGLSNLVSVALRTSHDGTGSLITAEIGLWFIALASVSYLMACEPPKPDDGDGFEYLPSAAP